MIAERDTKTDFRAEEEAGKKYIEGYFAVFGDTYEMNEGISESIDPTAFDETLGGDVRALINHDTGMVLGRTKNGTLRLAVDSTGLYGRLEVNESDSDAMNAWARVKRGDVDQASFGFEILSEECQKRGDGGMHFVLKKIRLHEVSVCTFPAYQRTQLSARGAEEALRQRENKIWKMKMEELIKKWH